MILSDNKPPARGVGRAIRESVLDYLSPLATLRRSPLAAEMIGRLRDHKIKILVLDRRQGDHTHVPLSRLTRKKPDWLPRDEAMILLADDLSSTITHSLFALKQKYSAHRIPEVNEHNLRIEDRLWLNVFSAADATAFAMLATMQLEHLHNRSYAPYAADPALGGFRCSEQMWLELKSRHASVTHLFGADALPDLSSPDPLAVILPRDGKADWGACIAGLRRRLMRCSLDATIADNPWLADVASGLAKKARGDWSGRWRPGSGYLRPDDLSRASRWSGRPTLEPDESANPFDGLSDRPQGRPDSPKILDRLRAEIDGLTNPRSRFRP